MDCIWKYIELILVDYFRQKLIRVIKYDSYWKTYQYTLKIAKGGKLKYK